jgi:hypothetical protein
LFPHPQPSERSLLFTFIGSVEYRKPTRVTMKKAIDSQLTNLTALMNGSYGYILDAPGPGESYTYASTNMTWNEILVGGHSHCADKVVTSMGSLQTVIS